MKRNEYEQFKHSLEEADAARNLIPLDEADHVQKILGYLRERPNARVIDVALALSVTPSQVREITSTDTFKTLYADANDTIGTPSFTPESMRKANIELVVRGIRRLTDMIDNMEAEQLVAAVTMGSKNLGIGVDKNQPLVSVNVQDPRRLSTEELERIVSMQVAQNEAPEASGS